MAESLGVHKSTASRLAAALERTGFLSRAGKRYRLGVELVRLGTLALRSFDVVATMQPAMEKLSRQTGETVNLAVPDGTGILNVAEIVTTPKGKTMKLYRSLLKSAQLVYEAGIFKVKFEFDVDKDINGKWIELNAAIDA